MTHGTAGGYINNGCRCDACRANTEKTRAYRARLRTLASDRNGTTRGSNIAPRDAGTSGGLAPNNGGSMQGQRTTHTRVRA
jgi:hypothetical protein